MRQPFEFEYCKCEHKVQKRIVLEKSGAEESRETLTISIIFFFCCCYCLNANGMECIGVVRCDAVGST